MRFVHIGIHKTGSTWLQRTLFATAADLAVAGTASAPAEITRHCRQLWSRDYARIDLTGWQRQLEELSTRHGLAPGEQALSDENLSGDMLSGARHRLIAERLARLWPEARILLVLRHPVSYALSAYDEYARLGGASSFRMLCQGHAAPGALIGRLDYRGLVDCYQRLFDPAGVLVLPYELLADDPAHFLRLVTDHVGLPMITRPPAALHLRHYASAGSLRRTTTRIGNLLGTRQVSWRRRPPVRQPWRADWLARQRRCRALAALLAIEDHDNRIDLTASELLESPRLAFWSGALEEYNYTVLP